MPKDVPSYEDLIYENLILKAQLNRSSAATSPTPSTTSIEPFVLDDNVEELEHYLFQSLHGQNRNSSVNGFEDVVFPSQEESIVLIHRAQQWISWVHFALHHPTFEEEHATFWTSCATPSQRLSYDPSWLAIYFSLLSVRVPFSKRTCLFLTLVPV